MRESNWAAPPRERLARTPRRVVKGCTLSPAGKDHAFFLPGGIADQEFYALIRGETPAISPGVSLRNQAWDILVEGAHGSNMDKRGDASQPVDIVPTMADKKDIVR